MNLKNINSIKKITIIGVGLIGGSIGLAIKKKLKNVKIIGFGRNVKKLIIAKQKKAIDEYTTDLKEAVKDADLIIISTPVELIVKFFEKIIPFVKNNCIISDVGSVKYEIIKTIKKLKTNKKINFVGAHPIAGSEKAGIYFAKEDLFENSICVICYDKNLATKDSFKKVKSLWQLLGSKVVTLSAKQHDRILSLTSHFLHVVAYVLAKLINKDKINLKFVGGSYKDMTRVAASNPELWAQICFMNRKFIKQNIDKFLKELTYLKNSIDDFEKLKKILKEAHKLKIMYEK